MSKLNPLNQCFLPKPLKLYNSLYIYIYISFFILAACWIALWVYLYVCAPKFWPIFALDYTTIVPNDRAAINQIIGQGMKSDLFIFLNSGFISSKTVNFYFIHVKPPASAFQHQCQTFFPLKDYTDGELFIGTYLYLFIYFMLLYSKIKIWSVRIGCTLLVK